MISGPLKFSCALLAFSSYTTSEVILPKWLWDRLFLQIGTSQIWAPCWTQNKCPFSTKRKFVLLYLEVLTVKRHNLNDSIVYKFPFIIQRALGFISLGSSPRLTFPWHGPVFSVIKEVNTWTCWQSWCHLHYSRLLRLHCCSSWSPFSNASSIGEPTCRSRFPTKIFTKFLSSIKRLFSDKVILF